MSLPKKTEKKIQKLIEKDLSEFKSKTKGNVSTLAMGSAADGIWYGMSYIVYNGINSYNTEYMYDYYTSYTWNGRPGVAFTDTVTQAWQSHTTRVSSSGQHAWQVPAWQNPNQPIYYYPMSINYNSIAGTQATFNLQYVDGTQYGHLKDSVRIPINNNTNTTGAFVAGYAHPYSSGVISAVLSYLNINFDSGWGMKKTWNNTFTISKSY